MIAIAQVKVYLCFRQFQEVLDPGAVLFVSVYRKAKIYKGRLTVVHDDLGRTEIIMGHILAVTVFKNSQ